MKTSTKICVLLACGLALAACGTDPVAGPDAPPATGTAPTISGVVPDRAFVGRDARVEVSGDATHWIDGTTVTFGAGVDVHSVTVASPTSLFAEVTVRDAASVGLTDVTVNGADGALALHSGFEIVPPLLVTTTGTLAQGSLVTVHVTNLDFDHPFDTSSGFGGQFKDIDIEPPPGVSLSVIDSASAYDLIAELTIDVDAQPGELVINSGPIAHGLRLSAGTLAVTPRTAVAIAPNTVTEGGVLDPFETALYTVSPPAPPSVTLIDGDVGFSLLPASGHFAESFTFTPINSFAQLDVAESLTDQYFVIAGDNPSAYASYDLDVVTVSLVQSTETTDANDTAATAQVIQVPALFADGTLASDRDVDFVAVPVTAADAGKLVSLMVQGAASTQVDVFADEAGTIPLGEFFGPTGDVLTTSPIPDGTQKIFVKFGGAGAFDASQNDYVAAIFLTQPH